MNQCHIRQGMNPDPSHGLNGSQVGTWREGYISLCRVFLHSASLLSLEITKLILFVNSLGLYMKASRSTEEIKEIKRREVFD